MPSYSTTAIHALRKFLGTNQASDIDVGFAALADDIDAVMVAHSSGTFVSRGSATTRGEGFVYFSTDVPQIDISDGTNWRPLRAAQQAWQNLPFTGFVAGGFIEHYRDSLGAVHIRGEVVAPPTTLASGTAVGQLPAGSRPSTRDAWPIAIGNSGPGPTMVRLKIEQGTGLITVYTPVPGGSSLAFAHEFRA